MLVDTHVHLWRLGGELDYSWVKGSALERDFLIKDLVEEASDVLPDKIVFVEAGCPPPQGVDEAQWVAKIAINEPRIRAIVASAPLELGVLAQRHLESLAKIPLVRGVRRLIQSEVSGFAAQPVFVKGVQMLKTYGFSFDICIRHYQMRDVLILVKQCPDVHFILDHIGKPDIKSGLHDPWFEDIGKLAAYDNVVACKISGMVTEADHENWTEADLKPYFDRVVEVFGMDRIMFGGDWPVSRLASDYPRWRATVERLAGGFSDDEKKKLFHDNAVRVYRLGGE